tara:strand:- start:552 stop:752 length:201 start_codon:yes stop_codon:yes gene_type:complete
MVLPFQNVQIQLMPGEKIPSFSLKLNPYMDAWRGTIPVFMTYLDTCYSVMILLKAMVGADLLKCCD